MNQTEFLRHWDTATHNEIIEAMKSKFPMARSFAIIAAVKNKIKSSDVIDEIRAATSDNGYFWKPYTIKDISLAALHLLGAEEYSGNKPEVTFWIDNNMDIN